MVTAMPRDDGRVLGFRFPEPCIALLHGPDDDRRILIQGDGAGSVEMPASSLAGFGDPREIAPDLFGRRVRRALSEGELELSWGTADGHARID
jgi:hypothetical protein